MGLQEKKVIGMLCVLSMCLTGCTKEDVNVSQGMTAIEALSYEEALEDFDKALLNGEDEQLILRGKGIAYIGLADYDQAVKYLSESLQKSKGKVSKLEYDTNYYLALAFYKNGEYQNAVDTYSAVIGMDQSQTEAYYDRALAYLQLGNLESALLDFDKTLSMDENNYTKYIDIYCELSQNGYEDQGTVYLNTALDADDKKKSDYDRGRIYYYLKDYAQALTYFEASTKNAGTDAYLYLGKTYEALGDYNYAASVYTDYVTEHTDAADIYNQLGLCKMTMQDYGGALEAFDAGIDVADTSEIQSLMLNKITALEYSGEFEQAKNLMEEYSKAYPEDEMTLQEQAFLKTR